jgi:GTP-binding protein
VALAFLIDLSEDNCLDAFDILYNELEAFSPELIAKQRVIVGTKLDLENTGERFLKLKEKYSAEKILGISVFSGEGIQELASVFESLVRETQ